MWQSKRMRYTRLDADAYIEGKADAMPEALCLRAGVLTMIRQFNQGLAENRRIRLHWWTSTRRQPLSASIFSGSKSESRGRKLCRSRTSQKLKIGVSVSVELLKRLTSDKCVLGELAHG